MPTQFGIPDQFTTAGTANAPHRRPSTTFNAKIKDVSPLKTSPPLGYVQARGGWSYQGGFHAMKYNVPETAPVLYESPLKGKGEPTLIPSHSLSGEKKGVIRLKDEHYEKINMEHNVNHPIYNIPQFNALSLYQ